MVNRQLQRISKVPRVSGEETKCVVLLGMVHVDLKVDSIEEAFVAAARASKMKWWKLIIGNEMCSRDIDEVSLA